MYTPFLFSRKSEVKAFHQLDKSLAPGCLPLFDLAAPSTSHDETKAEKFVVDNIALMVEAVAGYPEILLDSSALDPGFQIGADQQSPLVFASQELVRMGCTPTPVVGIHRDTGYLEAARAVIELTGKRKLGIRLDSTDMSTARLSSRSIDEMLQYFGVERAGVILLLDFKCVFGLDPNSLSVIASRLLGAIPGNWGGVVIAGYGLPDRITDAAQVRGQGFVQRIEMQVFENVRRAYSGSPTWFGDYTSLSPATAELDIKLMHKTICPKIVYSLDQSWFIVRGGPFSTDAKGYRQYHDLATEVVALQEFSGPAFSSGDRYIFERSQGHPKTGTPATWITATVNHHIVLTVLAQSHRT